MKYRALGTALLSAAALLPGCASRGTAMVEAGDRVYLTTLGPVFAVHPARPHSFSLGAGDAIGEALFLGYVASLNLPDDSTRYAEVSTDAPASE